MSVTTYSGGTVALQWNPAAGATSRSLWRNTGRRLVTRRLREIAQKVEFLEAGDAKAAVVSRKMPPWFADPQFGHDAASVGHVV